MRTPTASAIRAPAGSLRRKLEQVTGVRALMMTLLFGSAVVINLDDLEALRAPTYLALGVLIGLTFVGSALSAVAVRFAADLRPVALGQLMGDAVLAGGLTLVTGGPESAFLFLFFLAIITASFVMGRTGALFSASACSLAYAMVALAQQGFVPALSSVSLLFAPLGRPELWISAVHLLSFYTVALLAGNLAERLGQVGTELERQSIDLHALRALNENIVSSVADGLCTIDLRGRVIAFNPAAARITGRPVAQVLGSTIEATLPELAVALADHETQRERHAGAVELDRGDGQTRYLDVTISPLHDAQRRHDGHILSFSDVTELRQLQNVLQRQRRLAAIGQLSASIAHEIRNPLAAISGAVEVLRDADRIGDMERRLVDIAVREIDRLNALIADFLSYARPRKLVKRAVDVPSLLEECVLLAQQDPRSAGIAFVLELPSEDEPLTIEGDPDALREVLWNLVRNAVEALEGQGTVTLRSKRAGMTLSGGVAISVRDDGPGLTEEARSRLFEPFFTTKPGGTGLGLATTHRAVEAHGGLIWSESGEDDVGTAFWIVLPGPKQARKPKLAALDPTATAEHLAPSIDQLLDALSVSSDYESVESDD